MTEKEYEDGNKEFDSIFEKYEAQKIHIQDWDEKDKKRVIYLQYVLADYEISKDKSNVDFKSE